MARTTNKSSTFTILASLLALALLATAGVMYLQSTEGGAEGGPAPALAAMSQAMPLHAASAVHGNPGSFDQLQDDVKRLSGLRRSGSSLALPGGAGPWGELDQHATAILAKREYVTAITTAAAAVAQHMPRMLAASDELLSRSGSTAVIQEFQRRGMAVQTAIAGLAANTANTDAGAVAQTIAVDMAYLRTVTDALGGAATNLDVAALDDATREVALVPVISELMDMEGLVQAGAAAVANLDGLAASLAALTDVAGSLLANEFSSLGAGGSGVLPLPMILFGLLGVALLLLIGLVVVHARTAIFERTSRAQSEQNETLLTTPSKNSASWSRQLMKRPSGSIPPRNKPKVRRCTWRGLLLRRLRKLPQPPGQLFRWQDPLRRFPVMQSVHQMLRGTQLM